MTNYDFGLEHISYKSDDTDVNEQHNVLKSNTFFTKTDKNEKAAARKRIFLTIYIQEQFIRNRQTINSTSMPNYNSEEIIKVFFLADRTTSG